MDYAVELLANAIIAQAVEDYVKAKIRVLKAGPLLRDELAEARVAECARFFRGKWFVELSGLNPERLIRLCDERAKRDASSSRGTKKIFIVSIDP